MSYILEALRRAESERERKRGGVPGLHAQPVPNASPDESGERRGAPWSWIVTGLVIGVLLMILWRWWSVEPLVDEAALARAPVGGNVSQDRTDPPAAPPPASPSTPEPTPPSATTPSATTPPTGSAPAAPAPAAPKTADAAPGNEKTPRASKPAPPPRSHATQAPRREADRTAAAPATAPATAPAARAASPQPAPAAQARPAQPVAPPPAPPPERLRTLAELPDDLRSSVPQLAFGGSVYSDMPAQRMVILNGQVLREGDALTNELQIEQIRPRSAVLRVRGQRFEMPF